MANTSLASIEAPFVAATYGELSRGKAGAAAAYLFGLPAIDPERAKLHERIHVTGDKLSNRAHKYLTLADEYNERRRFARDMANPPANVYPGWHSRRAPVKPQDPATRVQVLYISPKLHTVEAAESQNVPRTSLHAHSKRWAGIDGGRAIKPLPKPKPSPLPSLYASPVAVVFNGETVGELRKVAPRNYVVHLLNGASVVESSRAAARAWITQQMGE